jgi:uncharacterized membrane protein YeiH
MKPPNDKVLLAADMVGTFLFAIEGATAAIQGELDLLGLIILAFATAVGGGITRDLLIGAVPPAALRDWRYPALAFSGGFFVFFLHPFVLGLHPTALMVMDAAALSLFAVAGTEKALVYGMHPFVAVMLGTITGAGGGTIRDIFLARVPLVLYTEVYAIAAIIGSTCLVIGRKLRMSPAAMLGGTVCFLLRVIAAWQHWHLPKAFHP